MVGGADESLFEELYAYYPGVVALLKRLGFDLDEARDLAQDVFVRVYQHMDDYRGDSKWSYLQQITRRLAFNRFRDQRAAKRAVHLEPLDVLESHEDHRNPPADVAADAKMQSVRLYAAVAQLDEKHKSAVMLYLADLSYDQIAAILGITVAALKSRLNVARARLRESFGVELTKQEDDA